MVLTDKEIAKDIILKMIEKDWILRTEYPEAETVADVVAKAYEVILKAVTKD